MHSYYSSRQTSGENTVVDLQVGALRRAGFEVGLVAQRTDEREKSRAYPLVAAATVATGRGPSPLADVRAFDPDVVLVHNLFPNFGRTWVHRWEGPLLAFLHNFRPLCPPGTFFRDGSVCLDCLDAHHALPAVRHACYRDSRAATVPLALGTRFGHDPLLSRADRLVALNPTMAGLYERAGVEPSRLSVVPNFLPSPAPPGPGGGPWLFVGRLTEAKGILSLVRAWPAGVPLLVTGSGPLRDAVAAEAPPGVVLLGEQPAERVAELMRSARGLVFPSRWFEGLPMVYLEALAAGTPVLAWEPSVVADLVRREGTGLVVDDLSAALRAADADFASLRAHCRAVFDRSYTEEAWLAALRELLGQVSRPTA